MKSAKRNVTNRIIIQQIDMCCCDCMCMYANMDGMCALPYLIS